eukprot:scpid84241/ scgid9816/ 
MKGPLLWTLCKLGMLLILASVICGVQGKGSKISKRSKFATTRKAAAVESGFRKPGRLQLSVTSRRRRSTNWRGQVASAEAARVKAMTASPTPHAHHHHPHGWYNSTVDRRDESRRPKRSRVPELTIAGCAVFAVVILALAILLLSVCDVRVHCTPSGCSGRTRDLLSALQSSVQNSLNMRGTVPYRPHREPMPTLRDDGDHGEEIIMIERYKVGGQMDQDSKDSLPTYPAM